MTPVDDSSDDSELPATLKMPAPPDLSQQQKAASEGLTALLRAAGILKEHEEARVTIDERGGIGVELDGLSPQHAENFARNLTALKLHGSEPGPIESATFGSLSPVEFLDRERERRDKPSKSKTPSGPSTRVK